VISRNGASCSAWHHRLRCLRAVGGDWLEELDYLDRMGVRKSSLCPHIASNLLDSRRREGD